MSDTYEEHIVNISHVLRRIVSRHARDNGKNLDAQRIKLSDFKLEAQELINLTRVWENRQHIGSMKPPEDKPILGSIGG
jgi:hypothetical protein